MTSFAGHNRLFWLLAGAAFLAWIAIFVVATPGIRGSDQYWYASEVRALVSGSDDTNSLWPFFILNDPSYANDPPFIHRGWVPYIVAIPAAYLGDYLGWIVTNFLLSLAAAALIYVACRNLQIEKRIAALAGLIYLLFPVYVWTSTQPLAEAFVGLVFAALIAIATGRLPSLVKFALLALVILLGQQLQTIFMPALVGLLVTWLVAEWIVSRRRSVGKTIAVISIAVATLLLMRGSSETLGVGIIQLMMNDVEGVSNMEVWLNDESISLDWPLYLDKLGTSLLRFVEISLSQVFFGPAVLLTILSTIGLFRLYRRRAQLNLHTRDNALLLLAMGIVCFAIYGAIVVFHQNQFRYVVYLLPILLVASAYLFQSEVGRLLDRRWPLPVALLALIGLDAALALHLRDESFDEAQELADLGRGFTQNDELRNATSLLDCYDGRRSIQLTYVAPDRKIIHVSPAHLERQWPALHQQTGADLLLCPAAIQVDALEGVDARLIDARPFSSEAFANLRLYRLEARP